MLNEEKLKELEQLAGCFFSLEKIATILQVDQDELARLCVRDKQSEEYAHYNRGKLISEAEVRKAVFKAAKDGSGPAQQLAMKIIEHEKLDML